MAELPLHHLPGRAPAPSFLNRVAHYPRKYVPARYVRWLPIFLAIPLVLWLLGPYTWRFVRPAVPDFHHAVEEELPSRPTKPFSPPPSIWTERAERVKDAFIHAYDGYMKYAFPADELMPLDGRSVDNFVGWGVTVYDALDTMWIMGLNQHFDEAVKYVATVDFFQRNGSAPFFETTIRCLGGLLSAYALSGDRVLLTKADDLARGLMPVFNTSSGMPEYAVYPMTGVLKGGWQPYAIWAESTSCQLEYKYLAHVTENHEYYNKVEHIMEIMYNYTGTDGFPTLWDKSKGTPVNTQFSVGAFADSGYEYLIKQWLLTGQSETKIRDIYIKSANEIVNKLLYITPNRKLLYVTDTNAGSPSHAFEHLACFLPGMLALGVKTLDLSPREKELHLWAAQGLAHTCYLTYADQLSGLGPDLMDMVHYNDKEGRWMKHVEEWENQGRPGDIPPGLAETPLEQSDSRKDYRPNKRSYLLRPETVESFYILWRTTGDEKWRQKGWNIFQAIDRHAKTSFGYASVRDVYQATPPLMNEMPSYFLAETLKYLYLLFADAELVSLDKWVFNTEAHPLPIFQWTEDEKQAYHIN